MVRSPTAMIPQPRRHGPEATGRFSALPVLRSGDGSRLYVLKVGQDFSGVEMELVLALANLMHADVIVSGLGVFHDRLEMLRRVGPAGDRLGHLVFSHQLCHRFEMLRQRQLPREVAFHGRRGPLLSCDPFGRWFKAFDKAGGHGKPRYAEVTVCWAKAWRWTAVVAARRSLLPSGAP